MDHKYFGMAAPLARSSLWALGTGVATVALTLFFGPLAFVLSPVPISLGAHDWSQGRRVTAVVAFLLGLAPLGWAVWYALALQFGWGDVGR